MVDGEISPGYEPVRDTVARVVDGFDGGLAVAAFVHGWPVVDLWAGNVGPDSLVHTRSAVKPVPGACLLQLVDRGGLALDDAVRRVWPELTAAKRGRLRVRHLLTPAAGLASVPPPGTGRFLLDWGATVGGLEAAKPDWDQGTPSGSTRSPSGTWWVSSFGGSTAAASVGIWRRS